MEFFAKIVYLFVCSQEPRITEMMEMKNPELLHQNVDVLEVGPSPPKHKFSSRSRRRFKRHWSSKRRSILIQNPPEHKAVASSAVPSDATCAANKDIESSENFKKDDSRSQISEIILENKDDDDQSGRSKGHRPIKPTRSFRSQSYQMLSSPATLCREIRKFVRDYATQDRPLLWSEIRKASILRWRGLMPTIRNCLVWAMFEGAQLGTTIEYQANKYPLNSNAGREACHLHAQFVGGILDDCFDYVHQENRSDFDSCDLDSTPVGTKAGHDFNYKICRSVVEVRNPSVGNLVSTTNSDTDKGLEIFTMPPGIGISKSAPEVDTGSLTSALVILSKGSRHGKEEAVDMSVQRRPKAPVTKVNATSLLEDPKGTDSDAKYVFYCLVLHISLFI